VNIPPHHDPACWGCGDNPTGIRLPTPQAEGESYYEATFSFAEHHQAAPGLVHFPSVTARIEIRFLEPVHINRTLTISARLQDDRGRRLEICGELRDSDDLLATAKGSFVHVSLEHFLRTPEGRAAGEAWREQLGG
jgi:acyl-CoA thioesterase FadM